MQLSHQRIFFSSATETVRSYLQRKSELYNQRCLDLFLIFNSVPSLFLWECYWFLGDLNLEAYIMYNVW